MSKRLKALGVCTAVVGLTVPTALNTTTASAAEVTASVAVGSAVAGSATVSPASVGLSWEKAQLSTSLFSSSNTSLVTLFKNLGPGVMRIGGSSVDRTMWNASGGGLTAGYVAPADVDRLAGFLQATGWKVIYGINFATETAAQMAGEISYVQGKLGSSVQSFELGNEPDLYHSNGLRPSTYTFSNYLTEWNADAGAIRASVPNAVLAGPASSWDYTHYTVPLAQNEGSNLGLLTQHYYTGSSCPDSTTGYTPSIAYLLAHPGNPTMEQAIASAAASNGVAGGARLAEANSFYSCTDATGAHLSGTPGVSNAFASALWATDFLFNAASYGINGINVHSGGSASYSPIQTGNGAVTSVQPEYYGMWLAAQATEGNQGTLLNTTVTAPSGTTLKAYALQLQDGSQSIVLLNESTSSAAVGLTNLEASATTATLTSMTAPSLSDTTPTDIKINGASFNTDGTWTTPPTTQTLSVSNGALTVNVPADSALLVNARPPLPKAGQSYTLKSSGSPYVIAPKPGVTSSAPLYQLPETSNAASWKVSGYNAIGYTLVNKATGLCMALPGWAQTTRAAVTQAPCDGSSDQKWNFNVGPNGTVELVSVPANQCAIVKDGSTASGAPVVKFNCNDAYPSRLWALETPAY